MKQASVNELQAIDHITDQLRQTYRGRYTAEAVDRTIHDIHQRFDGQPIRDFVPLLVERIARKELGPPSA